MSYRCTLPATFSFMNKVSLIIVRQKKLWDILLLKCSSQLCRMELGALRTLNYPLWEVNLGNLGKHEPDAQKDRFLSRCILRKESSRQSTLESMFDHEYFFGIMTVHLHLGNLGIKFLSFHRNSKQCFVVVSKVWGVENSVFLPFCKWLIRCYLYLKF